MKRTLIAIVVGSALALGWGAAALANTSPNGHGQPGAPNTTCSTFTVTPGSSVAAGGSVFNPSGTSGMVYAGNPDTASLANANSVKAVSQYDVACFQQTTVH